MKKRLMAIVKPFKAEAVVGALAAGGASGIMVSECRGYGRQKGHLELYQGSEYQITFLPKVRVEAVVDSDRLGAAIQAVVDAARTGRIGDGKVFVTAAVDDAPAWGRPGPRLIASGASLAKAVIEERRSSP